MSVQNPKRTVTKQDLADFYQEILPYLGGSGGSGGCGSMFIITAPVSGLIGYTVAINDTSGNSWTGTVGSDLKCKISGVWGTGTLTITCPMCEEATVSVENYKLYNVALVYDSPVDTTFDKAYGYVNKFVTAGTNYLAGTIYHIHSGGAYNTRYSDSSDIVNLSWSNMTANDRSGSYNIFNNDLTYTNSGVNTSVTLNKSGYVVKSIGTAEDMATMKNTSTFSAYHVDAGHVESLDDSTKTVVWLSYYPEA